MLLVGDFGFAAVNTCDGTTGAEPPAYIEAQNYLEKKVRAFANSKDVAPLADGMLSQLLLAKSPVILSWMKSRGLGTKSEDEIAREWREYFARNFILVSSAHKDQKLNQAIAALMEDINAHVFSENFKTKLLGAFKEAKSLSLKAVKKFHLPEKSQQEILMRIQSIELHWMGKFLESHFASAPLEFLSWGVAYDPRHKSINIGVNVLSYGDDETLLAVLLHEIGHALDSCRWTSEVDSRWPFEKVGQCLRSSQSIGAKKRDDSQLASEIKKGNITQEMAAFLKKNPTCNKSTYPPIGVQADQLPESFADWFSAEALSQKENLRAHLRSDLCQETKLNQGSSYVSNADRLNGIYLVHPKLRQILGVSGRPARDYCSL